MRPREADRTLEANCASCGAKLWGRTSPKFAQSATVQARTQ